jgi:hypothetical protein
MHIEKTLIHFGSARFDTSAEPENDINPIRGQSFLAWLRPKLEALGYAVDGPDTEDWGWYVRVKCPTGSYIVGAIAIPDRDETAWMIQLWRERSLREWITRKGRQQRDDAFAQLVERIIRQDADATEVFTEELLSRGLWRSPVWMTSSEEGSATSKEP